MKDQKEHSGIISLTNAQRIKRACSVIIPLCFLSVFIALLVISCANDIYAFVKPQAEANVYFKRDDTLNTKAKQLEDGGIINNPALFSMYVRSKNAEDKVSSFEGNVLLDSSMSYREILKVFSETKNSE